MKSLLMAMLLGIVIICGVGCRKTDMESPAALSGYWELRFVQGGYQTSGPSGGFSPGNGNILKFDGDRFWSYSNGLARDSGQCEVAKDIVSPNGNKMDQLTILRPSYKTDYFFQLGNNTLTLYLGAIARNGTISTYTRLSPSRIPVGLE